MLSVVLMGLLVGTFGSEMVSGQNYYSEVEVDVRLEPGPGYVDPRRQNIGTPESVDEIKTNVDCWADDMQEDFPKGVYRGPLFEPSLVELNYKPRFRYIKGMGSSITSEIGTTTVIQPVEFKSSHIMNGASEVWVQVPVPADSLHILETYRGMSVGSNYYHSYYYSSIHVYRGHVSDIDVRFGDTYTAISQQSTATLNGVTVRPEAVVPIRESDYYNNRPYVKINMFIESDEPYTFVYNLITADKKPQLFITDSFNFEPISIQYNYETRLVGSFRRYDIVNMLSIPHSGYDTSPRPSEEIPCIAGGYTYVKDVEETDIHLATGFIFTRGIGNHYMFGKEFNMKAGETMIFYPDIDWNEYDSGDYVSFYLPFISNQELGTNVNITTHNYISHGKITRWRSPTWNYRDFILYTTPDNVTNEGKSGADYIALHFKENFTFTLLFTAKDLEYDFYDSEDEVSLPYVTRFQGRWSNSKMIIVSETYYRDPESPWTHDTWTFENREWFFYNPYIVAELTKDIWAQVNSTVEGKESYSHVFESSAYFSDIHLEIEGSEGMSWSQRIELVDKVFRYTIPVYGVARWAFRAEDGEGAGNPIESVKDIVQGGITRMIDTAQKIVGYIYDGLRWLLNTIWDVLNIIYNAIIEFVGWFVNLLQDIYTVLGVIAERIAFIAGMIAFVAIIAMVSKVSKVVDLGGGD